MGTANIQQQIDVSLYWNINQTLSYNAILNFIVGTRNIGKSYGFKKYVIKKFLKNKKQFIYLRRYKTEFDTIKTYFDDMRNEFEGVRFKVESGKFYINDEIAGYYWSLSTAQKYKSTPYPNVDTVGYDEVLIDVKSNARYLKNEVEVLLNAIETIFRMRTPKVFMLANAFSVTNPYFLYFNIKLPKSKSKIYCKNNILVQLAQNKGFTDFKSQTPFYQMLHNTEFKKQVVENQFTKDRYDFIGKAPEHAKYLFTIEAKGVKYGVWNAFKLGHWFISTKVDKTCDIIFITTLDDHRPNTMVLKGASQSIYIKYLIDNFRRGLIYFDKIDTYNIVFDAVRGSI